MKKNIKVFGLAVAVSFLMVGCMEMADFSKGFLDGYDAGYNGYTLIGSSSSQSDCSSACANKGYTYYRYNPSTELCYCK